MSDLIAAQEQMEKAITRLEAAVKSRGGNGSADPDIHDALTSARADYENLRSVTDTVSNRLDAAINRLRATLDEGMEN